MAVGSYSYQIELIAGTMFRLLVEGGWELLQKNDLMVDNKSRLFVVVGNYSYKTELMDDAKLRLWGWNYS